MRAFCLSPKICCWWVIALALASLSIRAAEAIVGVDFSVPIGAVRPLHGINKGPLAPGGVFDLIEEHTELGIPFTRLHDCGWPNPYVVDHHVIFPNPKADPTHPESYEFRLTDEYISAVLKTGAEPIYRLGESIEHTSIKRHVHPPADIERWVGACLGIIRHYNEGWANGFRHNIRYWEIWNEPENRPAMWTGSDEDYFRLYLAASTAIKRQFPHLKVGGPSLGATGAFVNGEFVPSEFAVRFVDFCRKNDAPLNFFSWHCYTADHTELMARARGIRRLLDSKGYTETESHLNEWNYLPGNDWGPISKSGNAALRQRHFNEMAGAPGAAFIATALLELQDAPVDVCNLFHGELGAFGIFNEHGVPQKTFGALRSFQGLMQTPRRVEAKGAIPGKLAVGAGLSADGREATILVSNFSDPRSEVVLNWKGFGWTGGVTAEIRSVDAANDFATARMERIADGTSTLRLNVKAPSLALIRLRAAAGAEAKTSLSIVEPGNRLVFQQDQSGGATFAMAGECAWSGATVEARLVETRTGKAGDWKPIATTQADLSYRGKITAPVGWYSLEARVLAGTHSATASVERVGVGEVFVVVGHSVAHGGDINLAGADDDRVSTIALPSGDRATQRRYETTGDGRFLPPLVARHFGSDIKPAPGGRGPYFWAKFAEHVAKAQNAPVLVLNAAFGGTSLEHWAKSSRGEHFEHLFVNSSIRMPYIQLEHALTKYAAVTGARAILSDHGQNDWPEKDEERVVANYKTWIDQARKDAGFAGLAVVVNRQSPPSRGAQVRRVQERVIKEHPACFAGPDYDTLAPHDTTDKVHLSAAGAEKAARLWAESLTADFFKRATPLLPKIKD